MEVNIDYRARATQAEQENARLRERLNKPEKYAGLQKIITEMLKLPSDAPLNEIVRVVRYLRDNKELYENGASERKILNQEKIKSFSEGRKQGINDAINILKGKLNDES